jgi:hypothetical protein
MCVCMHTYAHVLRLAERRTVLVCVVWLTIATLTFDLFEGLFLFMWILVHIITLRLLFTSIAGNIQVSLSLSLSLSVCMYLFVEVS